MKIGKMSWKKSFSVAFRPLNLPLSLLFVSTCVHPGECLTVEHV
jgi:hypothetical protein